MARDCVTVFAGSQSAAWRAGLPPLILWETFFNWL